MPQPDRTPSAATASQRCPESSQEGARCIYAAGHDGRHFAKDSFSYYTWGDEGPSIRNTGRTPPPTMGVTAMAAMFPQPVARPPVRCPICYGKTTVPSGFYEDDSTTSALPIKCRSCGGRGIV